MSDVWSGRFGTITSDTSGRRSFPISSISRWSLVSLFLLFLGHTARDRQENYEPIEPMYVCAMALASISTGWRCCETSIVHARSIVLCVCLCVSSQHSTYYIIAVCIDSCSMFFYFLCFVSRISFVFFTYWPAGLYYSRSNHVNCSVSFGCRWVCQLNGRDVPSYSILMLFPPYSQWNWNGIDSSSCVVHHATIIRKLPIVYQSLTSCSLVRVTQWMIIVFCIANIYIYISSGLLFSLLDM